METYLNVDELTTLLEVFEDQNFASTYLLMKTASVELWKAWVKLKLTARGIITFFE